MLSLFFNPMAVKKNLKDNLVISTRIEVEIYETLTDLAALESINSGKKICVQDLIRQALHYVYRDNDKMRECFRRGREKANMRFRFKPKKKR